MRFLRSPLIYQWGMSPLIETVMRMSVTPNFDGKSNASQSGAFYKCPVGGYASLRPGHCPKCHERLTLTTAANSSHVLPIPNLTASGGDDDRELRQESRP